MKVGGRAPRSNSTRRDIVTLQRRCDQEEPVSFVGGQQDTLQSL